MTVGPVYSRPQRHLPTPINCCGPRILGAHHPDVDIVRYLPGYDGRCNVTAPVAGRCGHERGPVALLYMRCSSGFAVAQRPGLSVHEDSEHRVAVLTEPQ